MEDKYEEIAAATRLMLSERRQSIAKIAEESGINEFRIKTWRKRCFPTSIITKTEYSPQNYTLFCHFILYIYLEDYERARSQFNADSKAANMNRFLIHKTEWIRPPSHFCGKLHLFCVLSKIFYTFALR